MNNNNNWGAFVSQDFILEPTGNGRLQGLSFAVKDVFEITGHTAGAGNPDWLSTHAPAEHTASSIERILAQGARLTGTTQTDELMYSLNGENFHYGTPVNPMALECIPGGSSSGSAVAVSAGLVDFALGTDTGGSVRIPSAYCGIYGFRPTHGLVSMSGVIPLAQSFDTLGWMSRDPNILLNVGISLLDQAEIKGAQFEKAYLAKDALAMADTNSADMVAERISAIHQLVEEFEEIDVASQGLLAWMNAFRNLQGLEIWGAHGQWIQSVEPTFGPGISDRFAWASTLREEDSQAFHDLRKGIRKSLADLLGEDNILILPTAPGNAPLLHQTGEEMEKRRIQTLQLSCIAGLAGLPQITIPLTGANGLPIGISVIAGHNQDIKLLTWVKVNAAYLTGVGVEVESEKGGESR